ncbi:hypothetical protein AQUCO_02000221v1 [Aquilegia coerulea]|uniref:Plant heme peroxidase family profile domain-containing protein n=1 Tax=Aquilegia coerulea TaxID=218851 RepID=A0A2G5DGI0_AQUCA|nr:hypothetical protein AQUCO_02000221v1 [Aquilegia coerulea]
MSSSSTTSDMSWQYIFKAAVFQFPHQDLKQYDNHNQFLVFIIHGVHKNLAYCRSGDAFWTGVAFPDTSSSSQDQLDILQLNDQFYSVDSHGSIWLLCDVASGAPNPTTAIPFASPPPMSEQLKNRCESMFSLIEMGGELHVAVRFQRRKTRKTCLIEIFKCDLSTHEWQKLKTLGDYALFLGTGTSISVKASEFSACNCEPGYIYFCYADYNYPSVHAPPDIGIINVDRHEIEYLNVGDKRTRRFSLPAWVTPKLLIGVAHCQFFRSRLYNFSGTGLPDPSLEPESLHLMRSRRQSSDDSKSHTEEPGVSMGYDGATGPVFGTNYNNTLVLGKGILHADQQLMAGEGTASWVEAYASDESLFRRDFAQVMMKLSSLRVLTKPLGQIRLNCSRVA